MFAPLHVKSDRSPGYGTASVEQLLSASVERGFPALALCDVENLYAQVQFHHTARAASIQPITGVELRAGYGTGALGRKEGRLVLLARDRAGYESLCRIVTRRRGAASARRSRVIPRGARVLARRTSSRDDPLGALESEPHIPSRDDLLDVLESGPRGVFFLSDDARVIERLLRAGVDAADVRFLLVRPGGAPSPPSGVAAVADPDVVMLEPQDRELHVLLAAIRQGRTIFEVTDAEPPERCLPGRAELLHRFADVPGALAESLAIAEACTLDLTDARPHLPALELPSGETAEDRLGALGRARLEAGRREGRFHGPEYEARLERELEVIRALGFAAYFLIVAEIAEHAHAAGIAVLGRGSAVGSFVAHALGLTAVDPLEHGLYFERFLHRDRRELPDIDLDLPSHRREEVLEWVFRRFGSERVAMVSAHQTFRRRGAWRAGLVALGTRPDVVDRFCDSMPEEDELWPPAGALPAQFRASAPLVERLIGKMQHLSVHPGGVVIAEPKLVAHTPLERAPKGVLVTQYDMHALEKIGLVKIDLLGNRALAAVQEAVEALPAPPAMADRDPATLETLRQARTVGCFQIETPSLRSTLRKLPVRGLADLVAALAIVRPGPASGEAKAAYVRRANGLEPAAPPHPRLGDIVRETHGMLLYEEQLMAAIAALTGWPLERADAMRAAILADPDAAALEREFVLAARSTGVEARDAADFWRLLGRFAAYSFNKAHATSYAQLSWQSAYLKTHAPSEFACAVLNHYGGHYPLRTVAAEFARRGVPLLPPHVNCSQTECRLGRTPSGTPPAPVRIGLGAVKYVTAANRKRILKERPFADVKDLLQRVPLPHRELEALVLCGACDGLPPLAPESYPFAHESLLALLKQTSSLRALEAFSFREARGGRTETYRALVRAHNEIRFLGMHPTAHPMRVLREEAERAGCVTSAELPAHAGRPVRIAGVVAAARRLVTQAGRIMQFVTLEDEHGLVEAVLFPTTYAALGDPVRNPGPFLVGGRVSEDPRDPTLHVTEVNPFHERTHPYDRPQ